MNTVLIGCIGKAILSKTFPLICHWEKVCIYMKKKGIQAMEREKLQKTATQRQNIDRKEYARLFSSFDAKNILNVIICMHFFFHPWNLLSTVLCQALC